MSHARDFGTESGDPKTAEQLVFDHRQADLDGPSMALCDYAVKLSLRPGDMTETDIEQLRKLGWTDEQISMATQVISYFNYINRVADGLGVDDEPWMDISRDVWLTRKARFVPSGATTMNQ
ncbi:MAG: hypothetical protein ACR2NP_11090 [Pirellulaceae bacterium]